MEPLLVMPDNPKLWLRTAAAGLGMFVMTLIAATAVKWVIIFIPIGPIGIAVCCDRLIRRKPQLVASEDGLWLLTWRGHHSVGWRDYLEIGPVEQLAGPVAAFFKSLGMSSGGLDELSFRVHWGPHTMNAVVIHRVPGHDIHTWHRKLTELASTHLASSATPARPA